MRITKHLFSWEGLDFEGQTLTGRLLAESKTAVKYELIKRQIITRKIVQKSNQFINLKRWLSGKQTLFFITQLHALLTTGLNLTKSIELLKENQSDTLFSELLSCINNALLNGEKLSNVLNLYPTLFDEIIIQLIISGEKSGCLDNALQQAIKYYDQKLKSTNQLLTALLYPLMLGLISIVVLATIMMFVIPQFESIYSQSDTQLPLLTLSLLNASKWTQQNFSFLITLIALCGTSLIILNRYKGFQLFHLIPRINQTLRKVNSLRFCQTLSGLYDAGLTITDCIESCRELSSDTEYQQAIDQSLIHIKQGDGLANALAKSYYFDNLMIQLIKTGEESASLGQMLQQCSGYFDSQLQDSLTRIKILLEPVLIVVLGIIIGVILVAMYLPVFNLGSSF